MSSSLEKDFLQAYDEYSDAIFRYCYLKTSDRDVAKDLNQQVFLKAWVYLRQGQTIKTFRPFLYRLAHNLVIDWYRQKKSSSLDNLLDQGFNPEDKRSGSLEKAEISWAKETLKKLNQEDQDLITWRYLDDLSPKEIATIVGEKENNVSVKLHRAMGRLRKLLEQ